MIFVPELFGKILYLCNKLLLKKLLGTFQKAFTLVYIYIYSQLKFAAIQKFYFW